MQKVSITVDSAWGAPLKPLETTLVIDKEGGKCTLGDVLSTIPGTAPKYEKSISNLTKLVEMIEGDIAYFSKYPGQSMAINRFSMIKSFINKEIEVLNQHN